VIESVQPTHLRLRLILRPSGLPFPLFGSYSGYGSDYGRNASSDSCELFSRTSCSVMFPSGRVPWYMLIFECVSDFQTARNCSRDLATLPVKRTATWPRSVNVFHISDFWRSIISQLLVVHMLSWPSVEVLQSLVLIAWSEFGSGRDSGLWMYSRVSICAAISVASI
jgi:hypothetical protein